MLAMVCTKPAVMRTAVGDFRRVLLYQELLSRLFEFKRLFVEEAVTPHQRAEMSMLWADLLDVYFSRVNYSYCVYNLPTFRADTRSAPKAFSLGSFRKANLHHAVSHYALFIRVAVAEAIFCHREALALQIGFDSVCYGSSDSIPHFYP
jgi:hypothetical protein